MKWFIFLSLILTSVFSFAYQWEDLENCQMTCSQKCSRLVRRLRILVDDFENNCYTQGRSCAGRLAAIRTNWSATSLGRACHDAGADCVVKLAQERRSWSASSLNTACKGDF